MQLICAFLFLVLALVLSASSRFPRGLACAFAYACACVVHVNQPLQSTETCCTPCISRSRLYRPTCIVRAICLLSSVYMCIPFTRTLKWISRNKEDTTHHTYAATTGFLLLVSWLFFHSPAKNDGALFFITKIDVWKIRGPVSGRIQKTLIAWSRCPDIIRDNNEEKTHNRERLIIGGFTQRIHVKQEFLGGLHCDATCSYERSIEFEEFLA